MVQDHLLAGAPGNPRRGDADSRSGGSYAVRWSAADRAGVSWDCLIRPVATLDGSQEHALLRVLPGVVHFLLLPLHRQAERLRLDHLLVERGGVAIATRIVPAFLVDLPRAKSLADWPALADSRGVPAGRADTGDADHRCHVAAAQRAAAFQSRPSPDGLFGR